MTDDITTECREAEPPRAEGGVLPSLHDDIALIARQETLLVFDAFDEDVAWRLGGLLRGWALAERAPVVVDVRRLDRPLFFAALPGSTPDNVEWIRRKVNVVTRFGRSSYGLGLELTRDATTLEKRYGLSLADYAAHGGGFPITVRGVGILGCVTVSGLPQRQDHAMVVRALREMTGIDASGLALSAA